MREAGRQCLTTLALELFVTAPALSDAGPHLASCAECQEEVAEMRRLGDEFHRRVYPVTRDAIRRAVAPGSPRAWGVDPWHEEAGALDVTAPSAIAVRPGRAADAA